MNELLEGIDESRLKALMSINSREDMEDVGGDEVRLLAQIALKLKKELSMVTWGAPKTVQQLINQLRKQEPDMEITALLRMREDFRDGKQIATVPLSISYERITGRFLSSFKGDGRKVLAFWAKPDPRTEAGEALTIDRDNNAPRSRDEFIRLCNQFWNWTEHDAICAEDEGYQPRMGWDGADFTHGVTKALYRIYQNAPDTGLPEGWLAIPAVPTQAHLDSIAMRERHDFGLLSEPYKESCRASARQVYEECSGQGFYTVPKP